MFFVQAKSTISASDKVLNETPARALVFLRGVVTNPPILDTLEKYGYTVKAHSDGFALLSAATGLAAGGVSTNPAIVAIGELSTWCSPGFHRVHAALKHEFPDQDLYVFDALSSATGAAAILAVELLLNRLDALESSKAREATKDVDAKALELLAERGIDSAERKRLRGLVETAKAGSHTAPPTDETATRAKALVDLRVWYEDWSETAHAVFERRADLIKLGLAQRQPRAAAVADPTPPVPAPIAPVPPAVPHMLPASSPPVLHA